MIGGQFMASIARRPDGRWRARYRDEAGREHSRHFVRKLDAKRWLDEVTASLVTGQYVDPAAGRVTFAAYFTQWSTRQVWAPGTERAMSLAARSATFAALPLGRIRRSHVETWVKAMTAAKLEPSTIRTRVQNVRSVLRAAVRDRLIASDPSEGVTLPRERRREAKMVLPTAEQVGAVFAATLEQYRALVALAAFAGLRLGEAAAVQVGDVDFLRRQLAIRRQVQRAGGRRTEIRPPKYASERTVYLPDALVQLLAWHVQRFRPGDDPGRWMFEASVGRPPHQNTIGYVWRTACRRAGVTGATFHDLRHFYASGLIAAGCDVVTVQMALGHRKATTTLNTYSHLWPTAEDRTRQAAAGLMTSVALPAADQERTAGPEHRP